jgi:uncharacterized protein
MDMLTARRGIDFVLGNAHDLGVRQARLAYHGGGEPTLNWAILTGSFEYAQSKAKGFGIQIQGMLATNGIFAAEKCKWITGHMQGATVSLDGSAIVQDIQRPFPSGRGSSKIVMETLRRMEEAGFPYSLRMTVLPDSATSLAGSVENLLLHYTPQRIIIEPVYSLGRGRRAGLAVEADLFIPAFRAARAAGRKHGVEVQYSAARLDVITERFCQSCGYGFNLTPRGSVSACYEVCSEDNEFADRFLFGSYIDADERYVLDNRKLTWLQERTVDAQPWCRDCFCRWHCAGDCPHKAASVTGRGGFTGHQRCLITRELTIDQILEKIVSAGGLYWCEK